MAQRARSAAGADGAPPDPAAEAAARAERQARKEAKKAAARERARRSHERKKAAKKGSGAQTSAPESAATDPASAPSTDESPLSGVLGGDDRAADEQPSAADLFNTPEKLSAFLAKMQKLGEVAARKNERSLRIVKALDWADDAGNPTDANLMGVQLMWPWLEEEGLQLLAMFGNRTMAVFGAGLLFGPAAITAWDEYEDRKAEREKARAAAKKTPAGETPARDATLEVKPEEH